MEYISLRLAFIQQKVTNTKRTVILKKRAVIKVKPINLKQNWHPGIQRSGGVRTPPPLKLSNLSNYRWYPLDSPPYENKFIHWTSPPPEKILDQREIKSMKIKQCSKVHDGRNPIFGVNIYKVLRVWQNREPSVREGGKQ